MKFLFLLLSVTFLFACGNKSSHTGITFCDTTCNSDTLKFTSDQKLKPRVIVSLRNCRADSITWTHDAMPANRQIHVGTFLNSLVRINRSALSCYIKDTSYVWLTFNDCITGRG